MIVAAVFLFSPSLIAVPFDAVYATIMNLPVRALNLLLLIALTVMMLIQVVGIILVIALLTLPAASCRMLTSRLSVMMAGSVAVSMVVSFGGILLSYFWNIPSGATITLFAAALYLLVVWGVRMRHSCS